MTRKTLQREAPVVGEPERKSYPSVIKSIDTTTRRIDFIISTETVDRYGDIIRVKGWNLKPYKANPVVLFGHQNREPPVAKAIRVWKEDGALRATAEFMSEELSPFAHSIFRMYEERFLRATSVGFMPREYEYIQDDEGHITGYDFVKSELLEFSAVPVPANPEALVNARAKGINTTPIKTWAEKTLDEWPEHEREIRSLYGVDRKGLENIRRKAAGTGAVYHLSAEETEELRRKNFGGNIVININGGAVERDVDVRSLANSRSEDREQERDTMKVKQGIFTVEAGQIDELKEACKDAELYPIQLADKGGKKQFLLLPEIDGGMMQGTKGIQVSMEVQGAKKSYIIDKAPKLAILAPEVLAENKDGMFELKCDEKDTHVQLTIKGANYHAIYKLHGMTDADAEIMAELVKTVDQHQPGDKDDADTKSTKDTKKPDTKGEKESKDDAGDEKDGNKESKDDADAGGDKKEAKDLEIGGYKITDPEAKKQILALLDADKAKSKKDDEAPIDIQKEVEKAEATLAAIEEALAKAKKSGQFVSKLVSRKLKTLGGYLRELADDLDPEGKVKVNGNGHSKSESEDDGEDQVDLKNLGTFLVKEVQPQLASLIAAEVKKARGQLD